MKLICKITVYKSYFLHFIRLKDPNFTKVQMSKKKKPAKVCTIREVQNCTTQFIQVRYFKKACKNSYNKY